MPRYPAYKISEGDVKRVVEVTAPLFASDVCAERRLDAVAMATGFESASTLRQVLSQNPVMLWDQDADAVFLDAVRLTSSGRAQLCGIGLGALVSAGLAWGDVSCQKVGSRTDYLRFLDGFRHKQVFSGRYAYRSSLSMWDERDPIQLMAFRDHFRGDTVVVTSPRNQAELCYDFDLGTNVSLPVGPWMACRVHLTSQDRHFQGPDSFVPIDWHDVSQTEQLFDGVRIICFDEADEAELLSLLWRHSSMKQIPRISSIKADASEISYDTDGSFFSLGYAALWHNDLPDDFLHLPVERRAHFAMTWMCEMVNYVQGCFFELGRMNSKPMPEHLRRQLVMV